MPARLFCKNLVVNLSQCDSFPVPPFPAEEKPPPVVSNVWRKWRHETPEIIETAFQTDISVEFDAALFINDEQEVEDALTILQNNFSVLQVCYLEGLAYSFLLYKSYPEISFFQFTKTISEQQKTEQQQKRLPRANVELAYQRATRGDEGSTL
jgi:hypothetical protein